MYKYSSFHDVLSRADAIINDEPYEPDTETWETYSLLQKVDALINTTPYKDYTNAYKAVDLLTANEHKAFKAILSWAKKRDMLVFTKVRLLDLVSPRYGTEEDKLLLYKVQSKHVDFVICNQDAKVVFILELNDSTHLRPDRIERDNFVYDVLIGSGYKFIQCYSITEEILDNALR